MKYCDDIETQPKSCDYYYVTASEQDEAKQIFRKFFENDGYYKRLCISQEI